MMNEKLASNFIDRDWEKAELFFPHPNTSSYIAVIEKLFRQGVKRYRIYSRDNSHFSEDIKNYLAIKCGPESIVDSDDAAHLIIEQDSEYLNSLLMSFIDNPKTIVAPRTSRHISNTQIFFVGIPKSGFHLFSRVLSDMGIAHGGKFSGQNDRQKWYTINYDHPHLTAREFFGQLSAHEYGGYEEVFFKRPIVFCYRHPADILLSEERYYAEDKFTALAHYFSRIPSKERLTELLSKNGIVGSLADRVGAYAQWLELPNVLGIPFEDIVGLEGGGCATRQIMTLWSVQLKLHVSGQPLEYARHLFGENNRTFRKGTIGQYYRQLDDKILEELRKIEYKYIFSKFGYTLDGSVYSTRSEQMRHRSLELFKQVIIDEQGYRLIENSTERKIEDETLYEWFGYYVGLVRGRYCAIEPGHRAFDPFRPQFDCRWHIASNLGELENILSSDPITANSRILLSDSADYEDVFVTKLVAHLVDRDINGCTLIRLGRTYIGSPHVLGEIDFSEIEPTDVPGVVSGRDKSEVIRKLNSLEQPPRMIEENFAQHNIVRYKGTFYGIPTALGAFDLDKNIGKLGEVLNNLDPNELKKEILAREAEMARDRPPRLVLEDFFGFNIISFRGKFYAIPQLVGPVDLEAQAPESIVGVRSGPSLESLKHQLADELIAPQSEQPHLNSTESSTELLEFSIWVVDRINGQVRRSTRNEIGMSKFAREIDEIKQVLKSRFSETRDG